MTSGRLRVVSVTHRGLTREGNEDCLVVGCEVTQESNSEILEQTIEIDQPVLCLVADGMGGHSCGEIASLYAGERLAALAATLPPRANAVGDAVETVNRELFDRMQAAAEYKGMGTTVAGILFFPQGCLCFNVGDSSVFRVQGAYLAKLSTDDVCLSVRSGVLTQALGGAPDYLAVCPHVHEEKDHGGRSYLICSDGLTDMVALDDMEELLSEDPRETVSKLLDAALANGGRDNVTIVFIQSMQEKTGVPPAP
jgi:serine/threonine protein phosphatase PrpC